MEEIPLLNCDLRVHLGIGSLGLRHLQRDLMDPVISGSGIGKERKESYLIIVVSNLTKNYDKEFLNANKLQLVFSQMINVLWIISILFHLHYLQCYIMQSILILAL